MGTSDFTVQKLFLLTQRPLHLLLLTHLLSLMEHQVCVVSWGMGKLSLTLPRLTTLTSRILSHLLIFFKKHSNW